LAKSLEKKEKKPWVKRRPSFQRAKKKNVSAWFSPKKVQEVGGKGKKKNKTATVQKKKKVVPTLDDGRSWGQEKSAPETAQREKIT